MSWVIGLDVHKDTIAAAALNPNGELTAEAEFANTAAGHADLHAWIGLHACEPRCGLEPSGGVGHAAALFLQQTGLEVVLVPSRLSAREATRNRRRGNSDPGDALAIARVVQREPRLSAFHHGGGHEDLTLPAPPARFQRLTRCCRPSREHPPASEPLNQHDARRYKQKCRERGESQYRRDGPQNEDDRVDDNGDFTCREVPAHESMSRYNRRHLMSPFSRGPQVRTLHFYQPDAGLSSSNASRRAGPRPGHASRPAAVMALALARQR